jgi:hypothetical protein
VSVTGSISTTTRRGRDRRADHAPDGGVAPVEHERQPAVEPPQPGDGEQELDEGAEHDHPRVQVELRALPLDLGHAEREPEHDDQVPGDGGERGKSEVLVRVEDADDDPGQPEQQHDREEHAREADGEGGIAAGVAEGSDQQRSEQDEEGGHAAEHEQRQPEERRRHPPRAGPLPALEQLAENRDERAGESSIRDQRAHEVRDLDGDGEGVDPAGDAEEVGAHHLPDEPERARDGGRERERGGRAREPAALPAQGVRRG